MAASHGLRVQTENKPQRISTVTSIYLIIMSNPTPKIVVTLLAVEFLVQ